MGDFSCGLVTMAANGPLFVFRRDCGIIVAYLNFPMELSRQTKTNAAIAYFFL